MWISDLQMQLLGLILTILVHLSYSLDYECDRELWDEGKHPGVKNLEFSCRSGKVIWHSPYGGIIITIKGPAKEHELCIQAGTFHTSAVISEMKPTGIKRLVTITEDKRQKKHQMCFSAHGPTYLFVEPQIGTFVSAKILIDYDVEANPKYGEDACSPCSDEELLYHYCTSDFVAIGHMDSIQPTQSANIIPVSLNMVKQQSTNYFTKRNSQKYYTGQIYSPAQCKMQHSRDKFIFMGKVKFDKAQLKCAPVYEDFLELHRTSKLKGTSYCS